MLLPGKSSIRIPVVRFGTDSTERVRDDLTVEEPLEIRVRPHDSASTPSSAHAISVTMRTPGDDFHLAAGFLFTEGVVRDREEIQEITFCAGADTPESADNIVEVRLRPGTPFDPESLDRHFYMTSSCGVCGKASLEAIEVSGVKPLAMESGSLSRDVVHRVPEALSNAQRVFAKTGGIHAAALLDPTGSLRAVAEDVGRHNAVDKLIGRQLLEGAMPLESSLMAVSGRSSFEIVQKALVARIATIVAIGAPSSLAVDTAKRFGMTLIGFARADGFNVYTGEERLK